MNLRILGAVLLVPVLIFTGGLTGGGCNYTKPQLVYEQACADAACLAQTRKHLPACRKKFSTRMTKIIRHDDGKERAPYLSMEVMDSLTACISKASNGALDPAAVDLSAFREISKDVRGNKAKRVGGACKDEPCGGIYMRPVVGQTTLLYGPA